jgi:hypothetical protein
MAPTGGRHPDHVSAVARAGGAALFEQGSAGGRCRMGPSWQQEGEGEERHGARGPAREKEGSGPSPDEWEGFGFFK